MAGWMDQKWIEDGIMDDGWTDRCMEDGLMDE